MIDEFQDKVMDIKWIETSDHTYLVAACFDGMVGMLEAMSEGDQLQMKWRWRTTKGNLTVDSGCTRIEYTQQEACQAA